MHGWRYVCALLAVVLAAAAAPAAEPVVVTLAERAATRTAVVTVGDVATVTGGDAATRDRIAKLDLAELKARDQIATVPRRLVEIRLQLAGLDPAGVTVTGAERAAVTAIRRAVTPEEVMAAVRADLVRRLPPTGVPVIELAMPIVVRMPEVPEAERVTVTAQPHARAVVGPGRVQMDVSIVAGGEKLLAFAVQVEARTAGAASPGVVPAAAVVPAQVTPGAKPAGPGEVLIRARQRAKMTVRLGSVEVVAMGEAQQDGRLGQTIQLQNVDSKKVISGRVVGPGAVEVDAGGAP